MIDMREEFKLEPRFKRKKFVLLSVFFTICWSIIIWYGYHFSDNLHDPTTFAICLFGGIVGLLFLAHMSSYENTGIARDRRIREYMEKWIAEKDMQNLGNYGTVWISKYKGYRHLSGLYDKGDNWYCLGLLLKSKDGPWKDKRIELFFNIETEEWHMEEIK